jgi:hypothetical protein
MARPGGRPAVHPHFWEAGEGQTEESIVQSHMRPAQSGKRTSQGLHGVRRAATSLEMCPSKSSTDFQKSPHGVSNNLLNH